MRTVFLIASLTLLTIVTAFGQGTDAKCPEITVVGPSGITAPGEAMFFRADIAGIDSRAPVRYLWKVSVGTITDGQGTNQIRVQTTAEQSGSNITATVTIKGLPEKCSNTGSEVAGVSTIPCRMPLDEYGNIEWPEEQARLDSLQIMLNDNPKSIGFFDIQIKSDATVDNTKKHIVKILKHFRSTNEDFNLGRLRFAIRKGQEHFTIKTWVYSDGVDLPKCDEDCTLLNGKHLYF